MVEDVPEPGIATDALLANAPEHAQHFFVVPREGYFEGKAGKAGRPGKADDDDGGSEN